MECNDLVLRRLDQDSFHWRDDLDTVVNFGFHERRVYTYQLIVTFS
jgi:hypothetical protein